MPNSHFLCLDLQHVQEYRSVNLFSKLQESVTLAGNTYVPNLLRPLLQADELFGTDDRHCSGGRAES